MRTIDTMTLKDHPYASEIVNACLVAFGGRPAMLLQTADYGNVYSPNTSFQAAIDSIHTAFPELKMRKCYQGTLFYIRDDIIATDFDITNKSFDEYKEIGVKMGQVLGYIEPIDLWRANRNYNMQIYVKAIDGLEYNIYGMVASQKWITKAQKQTQQFMAAFRKSPLHDYIVSAHFVFEKVYHEYDVCLALSAFNANIPEIWEVVENAARNHLWNIGLPSNELNSYPYDIRHNAFHRGALIALMAVCEGMTNDGHNPKLFAFKSDVIHVLRAKDMLTNATTNGFNDIKNLFLRHFPEETNVDFEDYEASIFQFEPTNIIQ